MAGVFAARGADAWVFRGDDGLDELTTTTTSSVWVVSRGEVSTATVDPAAHGLAPATMEHLRGGDAAHNAEVVRRLLAGEQGAVRDARPCSMPALRLLSTRPVPAGVGRRGAGPQGIARARDAVDSGAARPRWSAG